MTPSDDASSALHASHASAAPSDWIVRFAPGIAAAGSVLDVAGGSGRHATWLAARGLQVTLVDRDAPALVQAKARAAHARSAARLMTLQADLEDGSPWPLPGRTFDAVVVTNYLHRPLVDHLLAAVAPGGWLLVETFAAGNETLGRPRRPEFLLAPGELLAWAARDPALQVVAYEAGRRDDPPRIVQRLAAWRRPSDAAAPVAPRLT